MGKLKIELLVTDCDGVLTDGKIPRRFSILDGRLPSTYPVVIFTSAVVYKETTERAASLGIEIISTREQGKLAALTRLCKKLSIKLENVAYIGDDIDDVSCLAIAGFSMAPKDGQKEARFMADKVLRINGGCGVLREAIRIIEKRSR